MADLNFVDDEFKSRSDQKLDYFFEIVHTSALRLYLCVVNWSASCHLGFLTHNIRLISCILLLHHPMADNCQPTHQIRLYVIILLVYVFQCVFTCICLGVLTCHLPRLSVKYVHFKPINLSKILNEVGIIASKKDLSYLKKLCNRTFLNEFNCHL